MSERLAAKLFVSPGELPYAMTDTTDGRYDLMKTQMLYVSDMGTELRNSISPYDCAAFCVKYAEALYPEFCNWIFRVFGQDIKISYKSDVLRVCEKIMDIMTERKVDAKDAWPYLTDLLRLQVCC